MGTYSDKIAGRLKGKNKRAGLSADARDDLVKEVRDNIESAYEHERINIEEATLDQRMRANDQWADSVKQERENDGRPVLTFNRLNTFINQVVNPIKQADMAIKVAPVDGETDPKLAKVYNGLLRQIQYQSSAQMVYGHTLDCQAGCGIGWFRICHDYPDDESFDQEIYIEKIDNPLSVFIDPGARDPVRADAMWAAVSEMWPRAKFKARWPDAAETSVEHPYSGGLSGFMWSTGDDIRVSEYFRKVAVTKTLAKLETGETIDITDKDEALLALMPIEATRTVHSYKVEKYFVSGSDVLEGPIAVPGCYLPLIPAVGGEIALDNGTYRFGVIRFARDAQRMYNANRTAMAEWIGQSPKAPYLVTPKMIASHRGIWESANLHNRPFLPYTPDKDAPGAKPERIQPAQMPDALASDAQFAVEDMKSGTNIHDASLGAKSNETSGVAIRARQMEGDVANYHFADNFKASLEHAGRIIVTWIPEIYDTPRVLRLLGEDGTEEMAPINTAVMDPATGEQIIINDLSRAKFDIRVTIGPSYSTRRIESAEQIGEFMKAIPPPQAALITDIYARNQDWEGHEEIAKRLKATIPPEIIEATKEDENGQPVPPQPPAPDPMVIKQIEKISAEIEKIKAEAAKTIVEAKQLDRQDMIIDIPGGQPATGGDTRTGGMPPPVAMPPQNVADMAYQERPNFFQ